MLIRLAACSEEELLFCVELLLLSLDLQPDGGRGWRNILLSEDSVGVVLFGGTGGDMVESLSPEDLSLPEDVPSR